MSVTNTAYILKDYNNSSVFLLMQAAKGEYLTWHCIFYYVLFHPMF